MLISAMNPSDPNVILALKRACKVATGDPLRRIKLRLRQRKLQTLVFDTPYPLERLKKILQKAELGWWSQDETHCLRYIFREAAKRGETDILEILKGSVQLGIRKGLRLSTCDLILWRFGPFEELFESENAKMLLSFFDSFLERSWDGKPENLCFEWEKRKEGLAHGVGNSTEYDLSGLRNIWRNASQRNLDAIFKSLRFLSQEYENFGPPCLLSLDLVVIGGETEVLEFMYEEGQVRSKPDPLLHRTDGN